MTTGTKIVIGAAAAITLIGGFLLLRSLRGDDQPVTIAGGSIRFNGHQKASFQENAGGRYWAYNPTGQHVAGRVNGNIGSLQITDVRAGGAPLVVTIEYEVDPTDTRTVTFGTNPQGRNPRVQMSKNGQPQDSNKFQRNTDIYRIITSEAGQIRSVTIDGLAGGRKYNTVTGNDVNLTVHFEN